MTKLKVHAIFDNGTRRENQSYLLVPEDATIGEAVYSFNRHHAQELWKVQQVELVGIVVSKDRDNREADIALAPMSVQLGDMLGPDDYLVLCSCNPPPPFPPPPAASAALAVASNPPGDSTAAPEAQAPQPGEEVTEEDGMSGLNGKTRRGGRTSNEVRSRHDFPKCNEVRKLHDHLSFPTLHLKRARKKRTPFDPHEGAVSRGQSGMSSTKISNNRAKKTRTQYNGPNSGVAYNYSKSSSEGAHHETFEDSPRKKARTQTSLHDGHVNHSTSQHYEIGSRHLCLMADGVKHPVIVQNQPGAPGSKLKSNERRILFEGYPKTTRRVTTSQLLPVPPERKKTFEDAKETTNNKIRDDSKQKQLKVEQQRNRKRAKGEEARSTQRKQRNKNRVMRLQQERKQFGDRTRYWGPFPDGKKSGSLIVQDTRRVYFANENETPYVIAKRFGVPVDKVVHDNCLNYHALRKNSRLKALTVIVLPLEETVNNDGDDSLGRNEKLNCDKGGSSFHSKFTEFVDNQQDTVPVINDEDASLGRDEKLNCDECASSFHFQTTKLNDQIDNQRDALVEQEGTEFGDQTRYWGPFPEGKKPGSLIVQDTRRVYFANENETPYVIAKRFRIPVGKVVYDNCLNYHALRQNSRLKALTVIVLPLEETVNNDGDDSLGRNEKLNCDKGGSSFHSKLTELDDSIGIQQGTVLVINDEDASLGRDEKLNCDECASSFHFETTELDNHIENQRDALTVNNEEDITFRWAEKLNYDESVWSFHSETNEFDDRIENQRDALPINNDADTNLGHGKKLNCEEGVSFYVEITEFEDSIAIPRDAVPVNKDGEASLGRNDNLNCDNGVSSFHSETAKFDDSIENQQDAMPVNNDGDSSLGRVEKLNCDKDALSFHSETTEIDGSIENERDAVPINNDGDTNLGHSEKLRWDEGVSSFHTETTEFEVNFEITRDAVPVNNDGDASLGRNDNLNGDKGVSSFCSETTELDDSIENQQDAMPGNNEGDSSLWRVEKLNCDEGASSFHSDTTDIDGSIENERDAVIEDEIKQEHLLSHPSSPFASTEIGLETTSDAKAAKPTRTATTTDEHVATSHGSTTSMAVSPSGGAKSHTGPMTSTLSSSETRTAVKAAKTTKTDITSDGYVGTSHGSDSAAIDPSE